MSTRHNTPFPGPFFFIPFPCVKMIENKNSSNANKYTEGTKQLDKEPTDQ